MSNIELRQRGSNHRCVNQNENRELHLTLIIKDKRKQRYMIFGEKTKIHALWCELAVPDRSIPGPRPCSLRAFRPSKSPVEFSNPTRTSRDALCESAFRLAALLMKALENRRYAREKLHCRVKENHEGNKHTIYTNTINHTPLPNKNPMSSYGGKICTTSPVLNEIIRGTVSGAVA